MKMTVEKLIAGQLFRLEGGRLPGGSAEALQDDVRSQVQNLIDDHIPAGSGIDAGIHFDFRRSNSDRLVFDLEFHHMAQDGSYDGWTAHSVTVRPSFVFGRAIKISGRNRSGVKEHLAEHFNRALSQVAEWDKGEGRWEIAQ